VLAVTILVLTVLEINDLIAIYFLSKPNLTNIYKAVMSSFLVIFGLLLLGSFVTLYVLFVALITSDPETYGFLNC
jgi:hypothetical protein